MIKILGIGLICRSLIVFIFQQINRNLWQSSDSDSDICSFSKQQKETKKVKQTADRGYSSKQETNVI